MRNWLKEGEIMEIRFMALGVRIHPGVEMSGGAARKAQVQGMPWFGPVRRG